MVYLFAGAATLGLLYFAARAYTGIPPAQLVRLMRFILGYGLIALGILLSITGRWSVGIFLGVLGAGAVTTGKIGPFDFGGTKRTAGTGSKVRSAWLEMSLDHDTGRMGGIVRAGQFAGRSLDDLDERALMSLYRQLAGDADSAALLEAYLDRRLAGWRENVESDGAARSGGSADTRPMTDEQAYEILGLAPGAGEAEIRAAHRRLMKRVHPDQGGSTFLAAKINQAKDWLLSKHR